MRDINTIVNEAITRYAAVKNLNPKNYDHSKIIKLLNDSRDWDPAGTTTFMLLRGLVEHYMRDTPISMERLIRDTEAALQEINDTKSLLAVVESPEAVEVVEAFGHKAMLMARAFKCTDEDEIKVFLQDKWDIAVVRMAALRSMQKLRPFQFTQGAPDEDRNLRINPVIYEFWNINSLVQTLSNQGIPGVTMALIRDPEEIMASYFVFAVKNGDNLTVLTDKARVPHPNYWKMSRGRRGVEREFEDRMNSHYFPYEILGIEEMVDEDGNHVAYVPPTVTSVVTYQSKSIKRGSIGTMGPWTIIWAGLVMERIRDEYGAQAKTLPALAYTTEMIIRPNTLVQKDSRLMTTGIYKPLDLQPLASTDVTKAAMESQIVRGHKFNQWMEDRYLPQVPAEVVNLMGSAQLDEARSATKLVMRTKEELSRMEFFNEKLTWFSSLNPVDFGTKEEVEADRLYIARSNAVEYIEALAKAEFQAEGKKVVAWYTEHVKANLQNILTSIINGTLELPIPSWFNQGAFSPTTYKHVRCRSTADKGSLHDLRYLPMGSARFGGWVNRESNRCAIHQDFPASYLFIISAHGPEALALLAGVKVEDLPVFLRNWTSHEPYLGNSILSRLDPLDSRAVNPWIKGFTGDVSIFLSKTAWREILKARGLPYAPPTMEPIRD